MSKKEKVKNALMGLAVVAILYVWTIIMFILDGAPFHWCDDVFNEWGKFFGFNIYTPIY